MCEHGEPVEIHPKNTFDYVILIAEAAGPLVARLARPVPDDAPEELRWRLLGLSPTVTIAAPRPLDQRLPPGVDLRGIGVCELTLHAREREHATLERASFELPAALAALLAPGDELHLRRPSQADLGLWLVRDRRLVVAAGALLGEDLGPEISIDREADGEALRVTIGGVATVMGTEPVDRAGFAVSAPGPRPRSMLGRGACVAIARRDVCDPQVAIGAALLLHHGPFRMLPWVRRRRT